MGFPRSVERKVSGLGFWFAFIVAGLLLIPAGTVRASGPDGTVRGLVTDSVSSNAVAGAEVLLTASDLPWAFQATTDVSGVFAIAVPNHEYTVQASEAAHSLQTTSVSVGSGQTVWLNLTLTPASARSAVLRGYATDSGSSAPVTQGRILSELTSGTIYRNVSALDASGHYEMALVPGWYRVSTDGVLGYVPYATSSVYLGTGQVRWLNLSLASNPLEAWINGTVLDGDNYALIAGARIAANVDGLQLPAVTSNATGEYSLQAPSGSVDIAVDAVGYVPLATSVYVYGPGEYSRTFYLTPLSADVHGYVRDGLTGVPIPGALVVASPFWSTGYFDQDPSDASGYYNLQLAADDYTMSATAPGYTSWYSWAFLYSGGTYWANVTLWPIVSSLRGYLLDATSATPVPGLTVYLTDARSSYSASATADGTGLFAFDAPPSPAITLRVLGTALYAGAIAYVGTRPYATTWANLSLERLSAQVQATVTDSSTGLSIASANLYVAWAYGSTWGTTDSGGVATVSTATGLALTVQAWAPGYFAWYGALPASDGLQTLSISLNPSLTANVTVQGYVLDAGTSAPIVSAYVRADGYQGSAPYDFTDGTGFYRLTLVPAPQTVHVTEYGYAEGLAGLSPAPGATVWLNFSLPHDSTGPRILDFTATPATNLQSSNPASLLAHVNETSFARATLSILMLRSTAANVGTFLNLGALSTASVAVTPTTLGNVSVASSWDTRTHVGRLSDGVTTEWWPAIASYSPFQVAIGGYWDNATLSSPAYGTAVFDTRSGSLLYVYTTYGYVGPAEQPSSTFTPYASGIRLDLTTAAVVGASLVTGSSYAIGSLRISVSSSVPAGAYAALLETWDAASNYAYAAVLLYTAADAEPPVANAGPDRSVDQGAPMVLNGTASSDNVGIENYTWTFVDGVARVLYGALANYVFTNPGSYAVTLTVRDAAGNSASDALLVTVLDTVAPTVSLDTPSEAATVHGTIGLAATASDNVAVVRVEFRVDGVTFGSDSTAPFAIALDTRSLSNGNHTILAVAFDAAGNSASSARHVTVQNASGGYAGLDVFVWAGLVVLLVAVAGLVLIFARRRRPHPPAEMPSPTPVAPPPAAAPAQVKEEDDWNL